MCSHPVGSVYWNLLPAAAAHLRNKEQRGSASGSPENVSDRKQTDVCLTVTLLVSPVAVSVSVVAVSVVAVSVSVVAVSVSPV